MKNPTKLYPKHVFENEKLNRALDIENRKILSIAHRGGSYDRIENTIESFQHALKNGTDLLEMDLQLTKDGIVVVCHDENLKRLCGVDANVSDLNYSELPKFAEKINLHHFHNTTLDASPFLNSKIPTLEEVFQAFPDTLMQLDLKAGSREVTRKTGELVKKYNREKNTIWGAMGDDQYLREYNPDLPRFFSPKGVLKVYLLYITGLLPFFRVTNGSYSVPKYSEAYEKWRSSTNATGTKIFFSVLKFMEITSQPLIEHLQARGVLVFHWVLNEEPDFEKSAAYKVNGIMTDKPVNLHEFLKKHDKQL